MSNNETHETPKKTARKLIRLVIKSLASVDTTNKLALMNSRSELDFELNMALLELDNDQSLSHDDEKLRENIYQLQTALSRYYDCETDSLKLPVMQLPRTAEEVRDISQKVSTLRKDYLGKKSDDGPGQNNKKTDKTMARELQREMGHLYDVRTRTDQQEQLSYEKKAAEQFMQQAQDFYEKRIERLEKIDTIKVAVLDTGVDKNHAYFKGVRGQRGTPLKEVKSFIDCDSHDTEGHGTKVAAVVLAMARHVDLYIAKVCGGKEITGVSQYVQAIKWAMQHEVHIINISASIDEDESIENIISEAESQNIIVFASASNNEANKPRAFPANLSKVLAVYSTDGGGKICKANPPPKCNDVNFSTLGESIRSPLDDCQFLTGVSYATAIASGMAANILTLADAYLHQSENDKRLRRQAFKKDGMKQIFVKISGNQDRDGYDYVCPIRLMEAGDSGYRGWFMDALKKQ